MNTTVPMSHVTKGQRQILKYVNKKHTPGSLQRPTYKVVPLQAWERPRGFQEVSFPDFVTTARDDGKVVSPTYWSHLPPGNTPGTHFC
jgi:hypothetical protein